MYFPLLSLHGWGERLGEGRRHNCAVMPKKDFLCRRNSAHSIPAIGLDRGVLSFFSGQPSQRYPLQYWKTPHKNASSIRHSNSV